MTGLSLMKRRVSIDRRYNNELIVPFKKRNELTAVRHLYHFLMLSSLLHRNRYQIYRLPLLYKVALLIFMQKKKDGSTIREAVLGNKMLKFTERCAHSGS